MKKHFALVLVMFMVSGLSVGVLAQESMPPAQEETVTETVTEDVAPVVVDEEPAQDPADPVTPVIEEVEQPEVSNAEFFVALTDAVKQISIVVKAEGAAKTTVVLTILIILAQLVVQLTKTSIFGKIFKKVGDQGKLLIVTGATTLVTIATLMLGGVSLIAAITSGAGLSAIMVFGHQIYKAFIEKKPKTV